jgi:hypothetical protein
MVSLCCRPTGRSRAHPAPARRGPTGAASPGPPPEALTADEAIACIRTAVAAQAGWIKDVEGDKDGGKRLCEVELVDETGKRHKLHVDVQTNQVVKAK